MPSYILRVHASMHPFPLAAAQLPRSAPCILRLVGRSSECQGRKAHGPAERQVDVYVQYMMRMQGCGEEQPNELQSLYTCTHAPALRRTTSSAATRRAGDEALLLLAILLLRADPVKG